ncbi:CHRD domain-containing protein [Spirosoma endophyticum]|uniref:CHRD domain-containing protein n=1 Tax=Spirosoma endophyticum TaxID=662367 RepID=A0A1I1F1Q4_9BACT|nr:CHRD domain-containing protein [Spirosoma endophyticum]SFB93335.1 CHRD domain-containing protein [Spirosoma endophyticum]
MNKKSTLLSIAALLTVGLALTSCLDDENPYTVGLGVTPPTMLTATLNGAGEKPTSTTVAATGTFTGSLNTTTRVLSYTVTYQGFTEPLTGGHLHKITAANGTGPVDIPFPSLTSPIIATTAALRQGQVDSLVAGLYYANLHTATYPAGAIRGDVKKL